MPDEGRVGEWLIENVATVQELADKLYLRPIAVPQRECASNTIPKILRLDESVAGAPRSLSGHCRAFLISDTPTLLFHHVDFCRAMLANRTGDE